MHLYFDESGDFAFPADRFDVYVQAALICPDSVLETVEQFVAGMKRELGVPELHAAELADEQLVEICRFVGAGPLSLVGQVTDTTVMTGEQISAHRKEQAALLADNLEQYKQPTASGPGRRPGISGTSSAPSWPRASTTPSTSRPTCWYR
jgi:hypothetical protein